MSYIKYFPYKQIREEQTIAIERALEAYKSGKRFVIINAGTGVGKSAVGITIARALEAKSYFITTQKILQKQYIEDFENFGLSSIKSASNYRCHANRGKDCSTVRREDKLLKENSKNRKCGGCTYIKELTEFLDGDLGITNFDYFLVATNYLEKTFKQRDLLVIDEAHNIETKLSSFIEIVFSENFAKKVLKIEVPKNLTTQKRIIDWVKSSYIPELKKVRIHMEEILEKFNLRKSMKEFVNIARRYEMIEKHEGKIKRFIKQYDKDNWIFNISETDITKERKFEFKPIDVSKLAHEYLFKDTPNILMMSATILNKNSFCELLGIKEEECEYIDIPSPFPLENKPILVNPVGSMSFRNINDTLPIMVQAINMILEQHKNEKGIIHVHSYKIAKYIKENIKSKRLLWHNDSNDKDKILYMHMNNKKPTVLLSPSMAEGVDLKGEFSRFQIICKVPFPYLGDKLIKKRMNKWKWWYPLQTVRTIVQAVGRSVRSKEDTAVTYILDSDFERFYYKNKHMFPKEFTDSIIR